MAFKPAEHKTVQARILVYAQEIGWEYVPRDGAEGRRGFDPSKESPSEQAAEASPYFDDLLDAQARIFNPKYAEGPGALVGDLRHLHSDISGNRDFLAYLRNSRTFYDREAGRELNLTLIDYERPENNVFQVTEEFYIHNGHHGTREDVVFLINGIPVLVIECKNATKDEAIALGVDQIRRYHSETPELFVPQMVFTATEAIGFSYGVTWNLIRRNIFNWKHEQRGNLEGKVKSFCSREHVLLLLKDYILFAEKDEEVQKFILRQHQTTAVERVVQRCLTAPPKSENRRGLVWHTQGSGKTFTMIKAAELLFRAADADKPTVLVLIDRNELEDQMLRNLAMLGIGNIQHAHSIAQLNKLLKDDYRGIIVSTIHKFQGMPADLNTRSNIFVMIDEAHRTTGGDLGVYLMAGIPRAVFIGFTGTPVDKTAYGKGTFKTFGTADQQGYLHKYSIRESIEDGTTLPLYYNLAPNEMLASPELMEKEFWSVAETEGITDIEELNKILDRAVNLKNFLKGDERVDKIARYVAEHYTKNVEPLGYKAFLVGVDRPACAKYKKGLDKYLPPEYSEVVYTGNNNDSKELKEFHIDEKKEKQVRKDFAKAAKLPKILIVTEKLLTGYDAPVLYAMYLDKPMRDHTLLQAIARVNRPYEVDEGEGNEKRKPHGFVLDFVGIFDKLEKALAFDSDEINAIVKDLGLLKVLFKNKMEQKAPQYLKLITHGFNDKDVDDLIAHFRDKERRKEFFKEFKELEMLFEIISPDAFLRPFLEDYTSLSAIYAVVAKAYTKTVYVDKAFQRKTNELVQKHVTSSPIAAVTDFIAINEQTIDLIKQKHGGDDTKVINLIKSIEKTAEEASGDPFLIAMADRAKAIQESYEDRQTSTQAALDELFAEIKRNEQRKREQAEKGYDSLRYFVFTTIQDAGVGNAETASAKIAKAFVDHPNWGQSDAELREMRKEVTFAVYAEKDDLDEVAAIVEKLVEKLLRSNA
ncbi:MAG TPA: HsdR family type I site-specific deoxyribonuclease [Bryobacteraceae bacterium]|jgi:type I restriction enzyme R subunit|nr:HsdR family type I site-specific deoxyribonuclease [Bryobacteraceae bacterium]